MAVNTVPRDYDIARMLADYEQRISFVERQIRNLGFLLPAPGVPYDTGWIAVPAAAGFTSSLEVRRRDGRAQLRGTLVPTVDWGAANSLQQPVAAGGIPAGLRTPISLVTLGPSGATTAATIFRVAVQSNGGIQVRCNTAAHTNSCSVNFPYFTS
jgi:hypothetical protein